MLKKYVITAILTGTLTALSCSFFSPKDPDIAGQQYDFAVQALDMYFIFREKLPSDLYAFATPKDLYKAVDEPYTRYFDKDEADNLMNQLSTRHGGIGVRIDSLANGYLLKDVFSGSPGDKAGLRAKDTILSVDDSTVAGMVWKKFTTMLSGDTGSTVVFHLRRADGEHSITVTRGEYLAPSVFVDSITMHTASIILTGFLEATNTDSGSQKEFARALDSTKWAQSTIIDLRDNGGGYIQQCIDITGQFVDSGTAMISYKNRGPDEAGTKSIETSDTLKTARRGTYKGRKLYLLTNRNTASASEIMVSCLMRRENVTVIGDTTYGKARGQVLLDGPEGVMAKVTSLTFIPVGGGASYDLVGIAPDRTVDSLDAFEVALQEIDASTAPAKRGTAARHLHPARCEKSLSNTVPTALFREGLLHD